MLTPQDYGAVGNGGSHPLSGVYQSLEAARVKYPFAVSLDDELDWCGLQAAIDAARYISPAPSDGSRDLGKTVSVPAGVYRINRSVSVRNVRALHVAGDGQPMIRWHGDTASPMFLIEDCDAVKFKSLWMMFSDSGSNTVLSAFDLVTGGLGQWTPHGVVFEDVRIGGFNLGAFQFGIRIFSGAGGDNNNDMHRLYRCVLNSYSEAGLLVDATQAHQIKLEDTEINGQGVGKCGIRCTKLLNMLQVKGCWGGGHTEMDFDFRATAFQADIDNWDSENSARLLQMGVGPFGSPCQLTIRNTRWASPSAIAADGLILKGWGPGAFTFTNNLIQTWAPGVVPKIYWQAPLDLGPRGAMIYETNKWVATQDFAAKPLQLFNVDVRDFGNTYWSPTQQKYVVF